MVTYTSNDPGLLAALERDAARHRDYTERAHAILAALELDGRAWVQRMHGNDEVHLVGLKFSEPIPTGWKTTLDPERPYLVPDTSTEAGRLADGLMKSLGPVPSVRTVAAEYGMPSVALITLDVGPRMCTPTIEHHPALGAVVAVWPGDPTESAPVDPAFWELQA